MGFGLTGALAAFLSFFWPRGVQGFGGKVPVSATLVPEAGEDPVRITTGKFWLSHLEAGAGTHGGFGFEGDTGLLALWWKCPHLGCTVPWRGAFNFEGVTGWFPLSLPRLDLHPRRRARLRPCARGPWTRWR